MLVRGSMGIGFTITEVEIRKKNWEKKNKEIGSSEGDALGEEIERKYYLQKHKKKMVWACEGEEIEGEREGEGRHAWSRKWFGI